MTTQVTISESALYSEFTTLEGIISELDRFGKLKLFKMDKGWHVSVDVYVTGKGVSFGVCSGFEHIKPFDAGIVCLERLRKALEDISEKF